MVDPMPALLLGGQRTLPPHLAQTPRIINMVPQDDWCLLGEMAVPD
jgi:hypothetical protein